MRCFASYTLHHSSRKVSLKSSLYHVGLGVLLSLIMAPVMWAQAPVGTISGLVTDPSGAVIKDAPINIKNKATGFTRQTKSENDGTYSAPALPAGDYEVQVQMQGFRTMLREITVTVGSIIKLDLAMEVGQTTEIVTVEASNTTRINYESHSIDGVVTRQKIQELPLNGRSFLQLAFLEPGVTASPGTTSQYNSLFSVSILGGDSSRTAITVDGGTVRNAIEGNTGMNFSQEVVQEFQLSSTNFDLSTGITSVGGVNIVTRTGGNAFHGSGYFFFRDHNMAAYPGLKRICQEPGAPTLCNAAAERKAIEDPFFARRNPGVWIGGPIIKDRLFFFSNYEYTNQTSIVSYQPNYATANSLAGNFASPYSGHLFSTRLDWRVTDKHTAFLRYSHDQNKGFGPRSGASLPSNWLQNKNFSDQTVVGITSTLTPTLVNDFRFNYTYWQNRNLFPDSTVCPTCVGLNFPQLEINGTNVTVGNTSNATQGRDLRRFTFLDTATWQKGSHRFRFGTEIEYAPGTGFWGYCDPACTVGLTPETVTSIPTSVLPLAVRQQLFPNLPTTIRTGQDLLNLPFAGAVVGVGDPSQPPPFNIDKAKVNQRLRLFGQDTWKIKPNFTLNYGLAWNFESTLVNRDLAKPQYLAPLYGNDLSPTNNNYHNFSPALGFAWSPGKSNKTVVRGGAGIYWDTEQLWMRLEERGYIGPLGNGRQQVPHTAFTNIFSTTPQNTIFVLTATGLTPLPNGAPLPAAGVLTTMTVGQFMQIYNAQIAAVTQKLSTLNLNVSGIQVGKTGSNLYPHDYPVMRSYHMNVGIQRDLGHDMVVNVDFVRRVFINTLLGSLDYNRFNRFTNGVQTPVIPRCSAAQANDVNAQCSTGSITFWTPGGREVYNGLLVKVDKRFSKRYLFTASYALTDRHAVNGISNLDDWFSTWGPTGSRHILNVSGLVDLPWGFQVGAISAMSSRGPLMPSVANIDLDGDGTSATPILGADFNCFNRGCGKDELAQAVASWNSNFAGKRDARNRLIPTLTLPQNYEFGDWFSSQDVRVTKTFTWRDNYKLAVFAEMFNVFNVANLGGYSFNLSNTSTFGQPTNRASQVFGSGGPRALQLGTRFSF
jgi:hypothetical protein